MESNLSSPRSTNHRAKPSLSSLLDIPLFLPVINPTMFANDPLRDHFHFWKCSICIINYYYSDGYDWWWYRLTPANWPKLSLSAPPQMSTLRPGRIKQFTQLHANAKLPPTVSIAPLVGGLLVDCRRDCYLFTLLEAGQHHRCEPWARGRSSNGQSIGPEQVSAHYSFPELIK